MLKKLVILTILLVLSVPVTAEGPSLLELDLDGAGFSITVTPNTVMEFVLINAYSGRDRYTVTIEDELQPPFGLALFQVGTAPEAKGNVPVKGGPYHLKKCQKLTVHVVRAATDKEKEKTWDFIIRTGHCGRWLTHYGFAFLPSKDDKFFTKALEADSSGEGGGFQILPEIDRGEADFEPTITFTFLPDSDTKSSALHPYFTAGLGADINERLVFAGLGWLIGDNVNIFVAAAGHQQTRLKGIYEVEQVLKEDLAADQLTDDTFDLNVIFGVGFRFDGNPFKKKQSGNSGGASQ